MFCKEASYWNRPVTRAMRSLCGRTLLVALGTGLFVASAQANVAQGASRHGRARFHVAANASRTRVAAVAAQWEAAYERRDKQTMLMRLMVPSTDAETLEKRYQWLRGYGPHDLPGSVHPPILFKTSKGSFVPSHYTVLHISPSGGHDWDVAVKESGSYRDEDGWWRVERVRHIKVGPYAGKWYVKDYVLIENPEDYGFYVDDISDKMTKVSK